MNLGKYENIVCDCGHRADLHIAKTKRSDEHIGCNIWVHDPRGIRYEHDCGCEKPPMEVVLDSVINKIELLANLQVQNMIKELKNKNLGM